MVEIKKQTVSYDEGQEVIVRNQPRRIDGPFSAVGRLSTIHNRQGADVFDKLAKVSQGAMRLFTDLKRHRDEQNNLVCYPTTELPKTHRETFSRQLRELRDIGLVRVAKRVMKGVSIGKPYKCAKQTYMIDPSALKCWDYQDAHSLWDQCKR